MKYANYANYLIKYAFYRETPGLIEFYRKNYIRLNLGTFDTPRHKILTGFLLSSNVQYKLCYYDLDPDIGNGSVLSNYKA